MAVARTSFEEQGPGASLDGIARRAGVANATLYRHFPTRTDLLVAVFADEIDELLRSGEESARDRSPLAGLRQWLLRYADHVASKQELSKALDGDDGRSASALVAQWRDSVRTVAARLLRRAQESGTVRPDIDAADILTVAGGIAVTAGSGEQRERLLGMFVDGLRPHP